MTPKNLGATGRVTPKGKRQQHDPIKDRPVDGSAQRRAQGAHRGTPQAAQREGGALRRGDALRLQRAAALRRQRRQRLIEAAIDRHGVAALAVLLDRLEHDFGDELRVNRRLEALIDLGPR
jgi:hypothetical protein